VYFDIGKQKIVWILKYRENDEEVAGNALKAKGGGYGQPQFFF
jgi:hypothetical protein